MIVVDTNVIAYLWIPGVWTMAAETLLQKDSHWAVPLLWRSEFRNVLVGYLKRGWMDLKTAFAIIAEAEGFFRGREYSVTSDHVLTLAHSSKCSAYDCEFVALAEDLETSLITTDKQILKAFPILTISL